MTTRISGKRPNNTNSSYPKSAGQPNHHQGNMASLKPGQAHRRGGT
jgi:hypothetical protein